MADKSPKKSTSKTAASKSLKEKRAIKKAKKGQGKEGFKDPFNRMLYGKPPASNGDFAYIQHIISSAQDKGRCGVVCPQGVLFRGQPEIEE